MGHCQKMEELISSPFFSLNSPLLAFFLNVERSHNYIYLFVSNFTSIFLSSKLTSAVKIIIFAWSFKPQNSRNGTIFQ